MTKLLNQFQDQMEQHLIRFKEEEQYLSSPNPRKRIFYPEIANGLYPPIKYAFLQYSYDSSIPFHDFANHVRSSQLFGINLFYPLLKNENHNLIKYFGKLVGKSFIELSGFEFEYSPEDDWLGEWHGEQRPDEYVTAADIALFFTDKDKRKYTFLVEIKFTEDGFTPCNGFPSKGNQNQEVCDDKNLLFADPSKCYLQTFHPRKSARNISTNSVTLI